MNDNRQQASQQFAQQASGRRGAFVELSEFLLCNKKWWLTPIILMLLLMGLMIALGSSAVAPFIYTLF